MQMRQEKQQALVLPERRDGPFQVNRQTERGDRTENGYALATAASCQTGAQTNHSAGNGIAKQIASRKPAEGKIAEYPAQDGPGQPPQQNDELPIHDGRHQILVGTAYRANWSGYCRPRLLITSCRSPCGLTRLVISASR